MELPELPELSLPFVAADTPAIPPAVPIAAHTAAIMVVLIMSFRPDGPPRGSCSECEEELPGAP